MTTELKFYVAKDGYYLDSNATPVAIGKIGATHFNSEASAVEFLNASGSVGEYTLHSYVEITEE